MAWSSVSRSGEDAELMPQEQVLEYEVLARTRPGQDRREQQPEEFEHVLSIADLRPRGDLPSHNLCALLVDHQEVEPSARADHHSGADCDRRAGRNQPARTGARAARVITRCPAGFRNALRRRCAPPRPTACDHDTGAALPPIRERIPGTISRLGCRRSRMGCGARAYLGASIPPRTCTGRRWYTSSRKRSWSAHRACMPSRSGPGS